MTEIRDFEKPFYISSTPLNTKKNCILKWNSIGIVRNFDVDESNQINVQFHDSTIHHTIEFPNEKNYFLSDLSYDAIAFASTKELHCIHFNKDFEENEWSLHMPKGETIKALALGQNFLAVGTNLRFIRLFTLNGTQCQLISVPGPIKALVTCNNNLAVVFNYLLPLPENENLEAMLFEINLDKKISITNLDFSPFKLPINMNSTLNWIGFTDEGTFCLFDSSGSLKFFKNNIGMNWIEVANLFKQLDKNVDNIFIISVSDLLQKVRCVFCHNAKYPSPEFLPIMQNLNFNLNLCKTNIELNLLEENNVLSNVKCSMLNSLMSNNIDTTYYIKETLKNQVDSLFKLFLESSKNGNEQRSLDCAKLIPSLKTIESLIKYSEQTNLVGLVPKLNDLIEDKKADINDQINIFTAMPTKQSTIQKKENDFLTDLTPLYINKSVYEKSNYNISKSDDIDMNEEKIIEKSNENNIKLIDEEDELLKLVTPLEKIDTSVKNPFKIK